MDIPLGMLIYAAQFVSEEQAWLSGLWYHKEMYVPSALEEKLQSATDLKNRRCLFLTVSGTFLQVGDMLSMSDRFSRGSEPNISGFVKLLDQLRAAPKPVLFDDPVAMKGTALTVDIVIAIDESMEEIQEQISAKSKMIFVTIAEDWSLAGDIRKSLS